MIAPHKFALMLYLVFDQKDNGLISVLSDFYRRDTDIDYFLTYVRGKTDDTLNKLMTSFDFSLEEKHKTDLLINESEESLSRDGKKVSKKFIKYGEKLQDKL